MYVLIVGVSFLLLVNPPQFFIMSNPIVCYYPSLYDNAHSCCSLLYVVFDVLKRCSYEAYVQKCVPLSFSILIIFTINASLRFSRHLF